MIDSFSDASANAKPDAGNAANVAAASTHRATTLHTRMSVAMIASPVDETEKSEDLCARSEICDADGLPKGNRGKVSKP